MIVREKILAQDTTTVTGPLLIPLYSLLVFHYILC